MYKLVVADDDEIICQGLARSIDWAAQEIELVGVAYDGEEALALIEREQPDIALLDIYMPFIDGLELCGLLAERFPRVKVLLLTAFKEFTFAERAIRLQVFDYLTKPLEPQKLLDALRRVKERIQFERTYVQAASQNLRALRSGYLAELITGGWAPDREQSRLLGLPWDGRYCVALLAFEALVDFSEQQGPLFNDLVAANLAMNTLGRLLAAEPQAQCLQQNSKIVLLLPAPAGEAAPVCAVLEGLVQALREEKVCDIYCGVGGIQPFEALHLSYLEARQSLEEQRLYGCANCVGRPPEPEACGSQPAARPWAALLESLRCGEYEAASGQLPCLQEALREQGATHAKMGMLRLFLEFCQRRQAQAALAAAGLQPQPLMQQLLEERSLAGVIGWAGRLIEGLQAAQAAQAPPAEQLVRGALAYVDENFTNPELDLRTIAESQHISVSHLCALVKAQTGDTLIAYLNRRRMEQARLLLASPNVKTYEVAYRCGYNSAQYFSYCFKNHAGVSPSEYRLQLLQGG